MTSIPSRSASRPAAWCQGRRPSSLRLSLRQNLSGVDLRRRDLENAHLYGKRLDNANLAGADLTDAQLTRASLRGADLSYTDLSGANLVEADFTGAFVDETTFDGAWMCGADLHRADWFSASTDRVYYDRRTRWPRGHSPSRPPPDTQCPVPWDNQVPGGRQERPLSVPQRRDGERRRLNLGIEAAGTAGQRDRPPPVPTCCSAKTATTRSAAAATTRWSSATARTASAAGWAPTASAAAQARHRPDLTPPRTTGRTVPSRSTHPGPHQSRRDRAARPRMPLTKATSSAPSRR
jgi:Pentapeptide repeats (8 copies)